MRWTVCGLPGECPRPPPVPQVQRSWGENGDADAAETGGERPPQPRPDVGAAPVSKALQDRCALVSPGCPSLPSLWAPSHPSVSASPGLVEGLRKRLLPAWCAPLAHGLSLLLVAVAVGVSGWVGANFPPGVSVMWLLSSSSSFLASFLGWEPLKVSGMQGARLPASGTRAPR